MMDFYNVTEGPDDGDDPWIINIPEMKGSRDVTTPEILPFQMNQPLKIWKFNIGTEEQPKFANVGD